MKKVGLLFALPFLLMGCDFGNKTPTQKIVKQYITNNYYVDDENPQGLDFFLQNDGTYGVGVGNAVCLDVITVPATYKNKAVSKVVSYGFSGEQETNNQLNMDEARVKRVILPESIISIGQCGLNWVFMESVVLPKSLETVGTEALDGEGLNSVEYRGTYAEFKEISFGDSWIRNYDTDNITFTFSDCTMTYDEFMNA